MLGALGPLLEARRDGDVEPGRKRRRAASEDVQASDRAEAGSDADSPAPGDAAAADGWFPVVMDNRVVDQKIFSRAGTVAFERGSARPFRFAKVFGEGDFSACGQMLLNPASEKPSRSTKEQAMFFFVHRGRIKVDINGTLISARPGDMFHVPRGNMYSLHNPHAEPALLFFAHAREVHVPGLHPEPDEGQAAPGGWEGGGEPEGAFIANTGMVS
ncbi:Mif2/CENP-C like-domain-containing protein [Hyaloraphidium curvatum]|nr:Mif2/CENP-C like-domain-containing protein [Hyaloraphidium curvatum]